MNDKQFIAIMDRLDRITRLLCLGVIQGRNVEQSIELLDSVGFRPVQIASILNRTPNQVNVTLSKIRTRSKKQEAIEKAAAGIDVQTKGGGENGQPG